jgi:hypothetical protein
MIRRIYYTGIDQGDGSVGVGFYESQQCIDLLEEHDPESYRGEGGGSFQVDGEIRGIYIQTLEEVKEEING